MPGAHACRTAARRPASFEGVEAARRDLPAIPGYDHAMRAWIVFWTGAATLALSGVAHAQSAKAMIEGARLRIDPAGCAADEDGDTVVVCGRSGSRYRLPLPNDTRPVEPVRASGAQTLVPHAPCGIFAGQRRCGKAEAAQYGYGEGRDPITVAGRLLGILPDAVPPR